MREKEVCPRCGAELEWVVLYNFGDPAMGVMAEYLKCPSLRCNYFVTHKQHKQERRA